MPGWIIFALLAAGVVWYETRNRDSSIGGQGTTVVGNPPGPPPGTLGGTPVVGNPPPAPTGIAADDSKVPKKGNLGGGGPGNAGAVARNRVAQKLPQTQPSWWAESLLEDIRYHPTENQAGIPANDFRNLGDNHGGRA